MTEAATIKNVKKEVKFRPGPVVLFVVSVMVTLTAIFGMSAWAHTVRYGHATQHVLIFLGGLGAGSALTTTFKTKQDK